MAFHKTEVVLGHVSDERERQVRLLHEGRIQFDCSSRIHDGTRLQVLVEEIGEVARAMMDGTREEVFEELIQVAAVAVACAEGVYHDLEEIA